MNLAIQAPIWAKLDASSGFRAYAVTKRPKQLKYKTFGCSGADGLGTLKHIASNIGFELLDRCSDSFLRWFLFLDSNETDAGFWIAWVCTCRTPSLFSSCLFRQVSLYHWICFG